MFFYHCLKTFLPLPKNKNIKKVKILNADSSIYPRTEEKKQIVLDLRLQLNTGERLNVEMQSISKKDFLPRILFYWAKLYTEDLNRGEHYEQLSSAYSLIFTEFEVIKSTKEFLTSFSIRSDTPPHFHLINHLQLIFVELTKFRKESIYDLFGLQDYWCYTIKNSTKMNSHEWEYLHGVHKEMTKAMDHLKALSIERKIRLLQDYRDKYIRDKKAEKDFAYEEGREKGMKQGIEKGKKETVLRMLEEGLDASLIQKLTEFSKSEIQKIQQKKS